MDRALQHTGRRFRRVIVVLAVGLVAVSAGAAWKVSALAREKRSIDERIRQVEARLEKAAQSPDEADRLISELDAYEDQAEQLQRNLLYRVAVHEKQAFITNEIRGVMAEFGAEVYSVPPEFGERVKHYIEQYQGPDRPLVASALTDAAGKIRVMQRIFEQEQLPPDLAYIPLVESALTGAQASAAGAVGMWQFTSATAKAYGLRVDDQVDERKDLRKATRAGCRYLRDLILDFGSGSSVMLALAAYNLGPSKVKQAVTSTVKDPIKQRSFWYLYRIKALPAETREYVPKVVAAIIIGRQPERFGF
jgi:soluble lytic murein transglycosylase-like protein